MKQAFGEVYTIKTKRQINEESDKNKCNYLYIKSRGIK